MTETSTLPNPSTNGVQAPAQATQAKTKAKRVRKHRPAPLTYDADKLRPASFSHPRVATQGVSCEALSPNTAFALTPDGESICIKKSARDCVRLQDGYLFDGKGLMVYLIVF